MCTKKTKFYSLENILSKNTIYNFVLVERNYGKIQFNKQRKSQKGD